MTAELIWQLRLARIWHLVPEVVKALQMDEN